MCMRQLLRVAIRSKNVIWEGTRPLRGEVPRGRNNRGNRRREETTLLQAENGLKSQNQKRCRQMKCLKHKVVAANDEDNDASREKLLED